MTEKIRKNKNELSEKEIVQMVKKEYFRRREEKLSFERSWLLNINFLMGNQYCYISPTGEVCLAEKNFPYESREVFNHIAPIIETRLAKLGKVRPSLGVRPSGNSENDLQTAKLCKSILSSLQSELNMSDIISKASVWSEVTGTVFYKVVWDENRGNVVGHIKEDGLVEKISADKKYPQSELVYDGDVDIVVVSPFEIYPFSSGDCSISNEPSIIHVRSEDASKIRQKYNLSDDVIVGETLDTISIDVGGFNDFSSGSSNIKKMVGGKKENQVMVYEYWQKPDEEYPFGRLIIVAGDTLLYDDVMPFDDYPFIKQVSGDTVGGFWGTSVIDRCIPVQRAYNGVKNRKLEYISRLTSGVLAVEEGSVDIDALCDEGLTPGKVLVYRNGANIPAFLPASTIPPALNDEEDRLYEELVNLTGVSELMRNSNLPDSVTSGTAISLLIEQDDTRLSVPAENIRQAVLEISKKVVKLYKEFATVPKLAKVADESGDLQIFYWKGSDLTSDDIVLETANELNESVASRKNMVLELFRLGLFSDENGKLSASKKAKIIDMLGFGSFESGQDQESLHIKRAKIENISSGDLVALEIDDHMVHIDEHTKYVLEKTISGKSEEELSKIINHIRDHKVLMKLNDNV